VTTARFAIEAAPEDVFEYLLDRRNLVTANHRKPIVEQSEPPTVTGSWAIIALDQLRARIDYQDVVAPTRVVAKVAASGRGSRGLAHIQAYELRGSGRGPTIVALEATSDRASLATRLLWPFLWRSVRRRMAKATSGR
jgi:hypothetical protein